MNHKNRKFVAPMIVVVSLSLSLLLLLVLGLGLGLALALALAGCTGHPLATPRIATAITTTKEITTTTTTTTTAGVDLEVLAVAQALDLDLDLDGQGNGNGYLDGAELIAGIQAYAAGEPIAGRVVDGRILIGLIQLYAARTPLGPSQPQPGSVETAFLALINQYRTQSMQCWDLLSDGWTPWPAEGPRELSPSPELTEAATYHSRFMAEHDCFAHRCPGEPDLQARIEQAGYTGWTAIGENIAAGIEDPEGVFDAWRDSPPHNRNMLTCQFEEIGIARVYAPGTRYGWYWTTDFGSR